MFDNLPFVLSQILIQPAYPSPSTKCITHDHPNFGSAWRAVDTIYFYAKALKLNYLAMQMIMLPKDYPVEKLWLYLQNIIILNQTKIL